MDQSLSRSVRTPSLFIQQPASDRQEYWEVSLPGLHPAHLKLAVHALRRFHQQNGDTISQPNLKIKDLLDNFAQALGGASFEQWIHRVQPELSRFAAKHGLSRPVDLIKWDRPPFGNPLTGRRVADRLFASGQPLPERLFTGVGNRMFTPQGIGLMDLQWAMERLTGERHFCTRQDLDQIRTVLSLPDEAIYSDELFEAAAGMDLDPAYRGLTLHDLLLLAYRLDIGCAFNLLGDNLVQPKRLAPVHQLYNTSTEDEQRIELLYELFRAKIEGAAAGWVDVLPFNDNLVFLRGQDGAFDWVVRDQRDAPFSGNRLYPVFAADEIPRAMLVGTEIKAKLHFKRGLWRELIEHSAESYHYANGGTTATYPGSDRVLANYFLATNDFTPRQPNSETRHADFVAHPLKNKCLMVSELITIDEFWNFLDDEWAGRRDEKEARTAGSWAPLDQVNGSDERHLPVCVTWYDAVGYCEYLERRTGLPMRLLTVEEWQEIAPARAAVDAFGSEAKKSIVEGVDPDGRVLEPPTYLPQYYTRFKSDECWILNEEGLPFLSSLSFGEWLGDYRGSAPDHVFAPVACAASGVALGRGPLERDLFEAWYVGRNNHLKVGFRVCYVASVDG